MATVGLPLTNACAPVADANSPERRTRASSQKPAFAEKPMEKPMAVQAHLRSHSAQMQQKLRLLATAFRVCERPSSAQVHKLARRTSMAPKDVEEWFDRRRILQEW